MAIHNELGKKGEELASAWLRSKGFEILHQNWRFSWYEIDIIAKKNEILHIIEVKLRNYSRYTHPEKSVTRKKFKQLQKAVDQFLFMNPNYKWIQYGILTITIFKDREPEFFLIEDVYLF